jgi:hypothetical protein
LWSEQSHSPCLIPISDSVATRHLLQELPTYCEPHFLDADPYGNLEVGKCGSDPPEQHATHPCQALKVNPGIGRQSLCSQLEKVIVGPLKVTHISTLIIIDALDECKDEEPASAILSMLSRYMGEIPKVRFFITGRPEPRIRSGFRLRSLLPVTEVLKLHEVKPEAVNSDIRLFFRTQLTSISKTRSDCNLTEEWPSSSDIDILCEKAAGLFIYASMATNFIASQSHHPAERLKLITSFPESTTYEGRSGTDLLYTQVLEQAFHDKQDLHLHFKTVVGAVLVVFNPLSVRALSDLLRMPETSATLHPLHSLFLIPDSEFNPIHVPHKSFRDFLTDPDRCKDQKFFIDPSVHHQKILLSCLHLMGERLRRNICGLDDFVSLGKVEDLPDRRKTYIGDALEYACQFWTKHLAEVSTSGYYVEEVHEAINKFITTQLLYWIEVLCLMGNLDVAVYAINDVAWRYHLVSCGLSAQ